MVIKIENIREFINSNEVFLEGLLSFDDDKYYYIDYFRKGAEVAESVEEEKLYKTKLKNIASQELKKAQAINNIDVIEKYEWVERKIKDW